MTYIDTLMDNCKKAKTAKPVKDFVLSKMSDLNNIDKAIYIIEEINGDNEKTFIALSDYKKQRNVLAQS